MIIIFRGGSPTSSPLVNTANFGAKFSAVSTGFDLSVPNATGISNTMLLPVNAVLAGDEPRLLPIGGTLEAGGKKFTVRTSSRGY
jgi:hypothetical protein